MPGLFLILLGMRLLLNTVDPQVNLQRRTFCDVQNIVERDPFGEDRQYLEVMEIAGRLVLSDLLTITVTKAPCGSGSGGGSER